MNATVPAANNVSFICSGQSFVNANFSWFRVQHGREVPLQDKVFITNNIGFNLYTSIATIPHVLESDEGRYHCRLSNSTGQNTRNPAWLAIIGK